MYVLSQPGHGSLENLKKINYPLQVCENGNTFCYFSYKTAGTEVISTLTPTSRYHNSSHDGGGGTGSHRGFTHLRPHLFHTLALLFYTADYVTTHMNNNGSTTVRFSSKGTAPLGVSYLGLSTSCFRTEKVSWMKGEMSTQTSTSPFAFFFQEQETRKNY